MCFTHIITVRHKHRLGYEAALNCIMMYSCSSHFEHKETFNYTIIKCSKAVL